MDSREVLVSIAMAVGVGLATAGAATIAFAAPTTAAASSVPARSAMNGHAAPCAKEGGNHQGTAPRVATGEALAAR